MKRVFPVLALAILLSAALITLAVTGETAKDPVCGMEVNPANTSFSLDSPHGKIYFCSQQCLDKFTANPSAYVPAASGSGEKEAAHKDCAGCDKNPAAGAHAEHAAASTAEGCDGNCGHTKVQEINDFHAAMTPLETAVNSGNVAMLKAAAADLAVKKEAIMKAKGPDGQCAHAFEAVRNDFGTKVEALVAAAQSSDEAAITQAFKEMHSAYQELDRCAR